MPDSPKTASASALPDESARLQRARRKASLMSDLGYALRPHTLKVGWPSLEGANYHLRQARQEGFEPKEIWEAAVSFLPDWAKPVPFSYEQALERPDLANQAKVGLAPPSAAPSPAPIPPS